jgi:alcohol dehydrogenase class IV
MEISPFKFFRPPRVDFGVNSVAALGAIASGFGSKALWVHGARPRSNGTITQSLSKAGLSIYEVEIPSEPSPSDVDRAVAENAGRKIDVVVAVGGGSVIDAGKAVSAMLPLGIPVVDYLEGVGAHQHPGTKAPFIAVPTTAGTGAEATFNAVLSSVGSCGFKKSLRHVNLMPDVAIVDPSLSLSCPPSVASACGMDALSQLLESFVSTKSNPLTDALAESGLERLKDSLVLSCTTSLDDAALRSNLSYAALVSGVTLAHAGLCTVHGFASSIGGLFHIPHGAVCGALLAPCMQRTVEKLLVAKGPVSHIVKFARAGEILCGRRGSTAEETCLMLLEKLRDYSESLNMPNLAAFGITQSDITAIADQTDNKNNPAVLDNSDLRKILMESLGISKPAARG